MRLLVFLYPLCFVLMVISGCGFHLKDAMDYQVENNQKIIVLNSYDPYGPLTRAVRMACRLHNIAIADPTEIKSETVSSVHIINALENQVSTSIFQDGTIAEYQIILNVQAQICKPGKNAHSINVKIYRSCFNNFLTALNKNLDIDSIRQAMYQKAAQQLVRKILTIHTY
ncbi:LPS assembly lipoprotein LptE [Candidatus Curculioniphilus buchneri]|uniref:LPS assembly lipoprotein LptE n=1 Tax=Candidatus Curculioniphilus buchneri TaxID=690594 RepID=UPI00376EA544